jgi:hypothetical protein
MHVRQGLPRPVGCCGLDDRGYRVYRYRVLDTAIAKHAYMETIISARMFGTCLNSVGTCLRVITNNVGSIGRPMHGIVLRQLDD